MNHPPDGARNDGAGSTNKAARDFDGDVTAANALEAGANAPNDTPRLTSDGVISPGGESRSMNEATTARSRSGIRVSPRILTALVGIPLVLLVVRAGGDWFKVLVLVLSLGALRELQMGIARSEPYGGARVVGAVAYVCVASAVWRGISEGWALATLLALLLLSVLFYDSRGRISLASLALTLLAAFYVGLFALLPPLLAVADGQWFWMMLFGVWGSDTLAYYVGRAFGRRRMSSLSPGKTWEGFAGGFVGAVVAVSLVGAGWKVPFESALTLGVVVGVAAPLGDLAESFLKRELGLKDLGTIFPGHGGILDRCDSILFAGLATSFWLRLL